MAASRLVLALRGDARHPVRRLDRWMLASVLREAPASAEARGASPTVQSGRAGRGDPGLTAPQVRRWLGSARTRGFVVVFATDLDGSPVVPPAWAVGDAGRARLKGVTGLRARLADLAALLLREPNGWRDAVEAIRVEDEPSTGPAPPPRVGLPVIRRNPGDGASDEDALANLAGIDHIVVLMMENRSFDQMLGYVDDGRSDVDDLPKVSWIDPNFVDLSILDPTSNDDHPPSDVLAGQELVLLVFRALAESACWSKTLLVVTYDEHGGFYDHVAPDDAPEPEPQFATYGVRVPALVVSPLVEPHTVSKSTFDHASIIRTILERFAPERVGDMPPRVGCARHLGSLLTRPPDQAVAPPDYRPVLERLEAWKRHHAKQKAVSSGQVAEPSDPPPIRGFPAEVLEGGRRLRALGLPAGHP